MPIPAPPPPPKPKSKSFCATYAPYVGAAAIALLGVVYWYYNHGEPSSDHQVGSEKPTETGCKVIKNVFEHFEGGGVLKHYKLENDSTCQMKAKVTEGAQHTGTVDGKTFKYADVGGQVCEVETGSKVVRCGTPKQWKNWIGGSARGGKRLYPNKYTGNPDNRLFPGLKDVRRMIKNPWW